MISGTRIAPNSTIEFFPVYTYMPKNRGGARPQPKRPLSAVTIKFDPPPAAHKLLNEIWPGTRTGAVMPGTAQPARIHGTRNALKYPTGSRSSPRSFRQPKSVEYSSANQSIREPEVRNGGLYVREHLPHDFAAWCMRGASGVLCAHFYSP